MEIRNPVSFPKKLGVTDPMTCGEANCPVVELNEQQSDGQFLAWFSQASCGYPEMPAHCAGAQEKPYGPCLVNRDGGLIKWVDGGEPDAHLASIDIRVFDAERAPTGLVRKNIVVRIDDATAAAILDREQEHSEDYAHGFAITVQHLTAAINTLSTQSFAGATPFEARRSALQALAGAVPTQLVPANPYDLHAWPKRAASVCNRVCNQSAKRDEEGSEPEHKASWWAAHHEDTLVIYPALKPRTRPSAQLITLDVVTPELPDWTEPAVPTVPAPIRWKINDELLLADTAREIPVNLYDNNALSGTPWRETTYGEVTDYTDKHNHSLQVCGDLTTGYIIRTTFTDHDATERITYFMVADEYA